MMKEKFNEIVREGLLLEHARQMGLELSPAEERAMLRIDKNTFEAIKNVVPIGGKKVFDPELVNRIGKATVEAFRTSAEEFRQEGDWEAYGAIYWVAGAQGFRL